MHDPGGDALFGPHAHDDDQPLQSPHRTLKPLHWNQPLHPPETWTLPPAQVNVLPSVHAAERLSCLYRPHAASGDICVAGVSRNFGPHAHDDDQPLQSPHRTLKPPHWNQPLHPPETWTLPPAQLYVLPSVHAANRLSCLCTSHVIVGGEGDGSI